MTDINTLTVTGRLTADPKIEKTNGGTSVAKFSIATNYYRKNVDPKNCVSFIECVLFGNGSNVVAEHCRKGSAIVVKGEIRQDRWTKDGKNHSRIYIVVDQFRMMGAKKDGPPAANESNGGGTQAGQSNTSGGYNDDEVPF